MKKQNKKMSPKEIIELIIQAVIALAALIIAIKSQGGGTQLPYIFKNIISNSLRNVNMITRRALTFLTALSMVMSWERLMFVFSLALLLSVIVRDTEVG